jgi:hypothetical protein
MQYLITFQRAISTFYVFCHVQRKKCLKPYFASAKQVDQLIFKDIFRYAAKHDLISLEEAERWLTYRDNRNDTAHDYGAGFADDTLALLTQFIIDAYRVNEMLKNQS